MLTMLLDWCYEYDDIIKKQGNWVEGVLLGQSELAYADHVVAANFTSSDKFECPAKVTFRSTGYELQVHDPARFEQTTAAAAVAVE